MNPSLSGTTEAFYRDILGEFSSNVNIAQLNAFPHWPIPTPTLHPEAPVSSLPFQSKFNYKVGRLKPFSSPANVNPLNFREGDPLFKIVREKARWEHEMNSLIRLARKGKKWADGLEHKLNLNKVRNANAETPIYTVSGYVDVAEHLSKDPAPYFRGKCNALAAGGCLVHCSIDGEKFLLIPKGKDMDSLCISGIGQHGGQVSEEGIKVSVPLTKGERVYQVVAKDQENAALVGVRQLQTCSIISARPGSKRPVSARTLIEIVAKDGAFTSIDIDCSGGKKFCTVDSDHILKLWDINTSVCVSEGEILSSYNQSLENCFDFVKFTHGSNSVFVSSGATVYVKDRRCSLSESVQEFSARNIIDDCENISLLIDSSSPSLMYVATSHRLLSLDARAGWLQRWTHLLQAPPMYGSVFCETRKSEEVVVLSSHFSNDTVAVVNRLGSNAVLSEAFPFAFPSSGDSLLLARTQGKCLSKSIQNRLEMATAGQTLLSSKRGSTSTFFKINSIGDVFCQKLVSDSENSGNTNPKLNEDDTHLLINTWSLWEDAHNDICSKIKPPLRCQVENLETTLNCIKVPRDVKKDPSTKQINKLIKRWHESFPAKDRKKRPPGDLYSKKIFFDLASYQDLLTKVILEPWESDGPKPQDIVQSWLDNNPVLAEGDHEGTSICESTSSYTAQLMSASFKRSEVDEYDKDGIFKKPTPRSSMPPRKKKRESLGF